MNEFLKTKKVALAILVWILSLPLVAETLQGGESVKQTFLYVNSQNSRITEKGNNERSALTSNPSKTISSTPSSPGLYAPPPGGGDPFGEFTPVGGNEIVFFLLLAGSFAIYKLISRRNHTSTND